MIFPTGAAPSELSKDPAKTVLPQALVVSDIKKFMYQGIKNCEISTPWDLKINKADRIHQLSSHMPCGAARTASLNGIKR
jgi:hypothetical protein